MSPDTKPRKTRPRALSAKSKANKTCGYCHKTFSKSEHLTRHVRSHTNERPFKCEVCLKCYGRNDSLIRHRRIHSKAQAEAAAQNGGTTSSSSNQPSASSPNYTSISDPLRPSSQAGPLDDQLGNSPVEPSSPNGFAHPNYRGVEPHYHQPSYSNGTDLSMIDPNLTNGNGHSNPGFNMFDTHTLIDPELQPVSGPPISQSYTFSSQPESHQTDPFPAWYTPDDFDFDPIEHRARNNVGSDHAGSLNEHDFSSPR